MDDSIFIDLEQTQLQPGQAVRGKILWALAKAPKALQLSLGWHTEGRGSCDRKVEAELNWNSEATSGEKPFEFTLPTSPYSFDGTLISLNWTLTLSVKKGKASHELPITVAPHAAAIALSAIPNESKRKPFSFLQR
jgi:hypothetical protein